MERINFLPESYLRRRHHRQMHMRKLMLGVCLCVALAAWFALQGLWNQRLASQRDDLATRAAAAEQQVAERERLTAEKSQLTHAIALHAQLSAPVLQTQVLSELSRLTPQDIALTDIESSVQRPAPRKPEANDNSRRRTSRNEDAQREPHEITMVITGFGPNDAAINDFVAELADHPLFTQVTPREVRNGTHQLYEVRQFTLYLTIDLDRKFERRNVSDAHTPALPASPSTRQEVARAR